MTESCGTGSSRHKLGIISHLGKHLGVTFLKASRVLQVWGQTGSKLYGSKSGADYIDNQRRFKLFCQAALQAIKVRRSHAHAPCGAAACGFLAE